MRNFKYKAIGSVLLIALILLSSFQQLKLDGMRNDLGINDTDDIKDKSPSVVFTTIALGSFRGFIANLLFLRSNRLQEERRYYEVHQLAKWIRGLQPKFTGAIAFMAWNMAYNISVTFDTPEERWVWVRKGMELYRDAIKNHSGDPELYREYGWIFQHKMGMNLDDANRLYKQQWAIQMVRILKEKPNLQEIAEVTRNPGLLDKKLSKLGLKQGDFLKILDVRKVSYPDLAKAVVEHPENEIPETVGKYLKEDKWKEEVKKFILTCERRRYDHTTLLYLLDGILDLEKTLDTIEGDWDLERLEERFRELGRLPVEFEKAVVMPSKAKKEVLSIIDNFFRDRWAWNEYLLDVRKMWKITQEYGNLDWRVSETHAIYWAKIGLEKEPDNVKCRRMVTQAMKDVVDRGKLLYFSSEAHQSIDWTFNVDLIDKACEVIEGNINILEEKKRGTFETGYENFLKDCVHALYISNRKKRAEEYAKKLMDRYPGKNLDYKNLDKIMTKEIAENLSSMNEDQARLGLQSFVEQSLQFQVLFGDEERAQFFWSRAKFVFNYFYEKTKNRKGRQGWTRSFYHMSEDIYKRYIELFPSRKAEFRFFFERMTVNEPRELKKPKKEDEKKEE